MAKASTWSKEKAERYAKSPVEDLAKRLTDYLQARAMMMDASGRHLDISAKEEWDRLVGHSRKHLKKPNLICGNNVWQIFSAFSCKSKANS